MYIWRSLGVTLLSTVSYGQASQDPTFESLLCQGQEIDQIADGLTKLFTEIKQKKTIAELKPEYQKFAEWLRIE